MINPESPMESPIVLMKSQAQRFMSFLLGPGVMALSDSFSKFFCDGTDDSRDAGLREAAGNQGTICRVPRVQCGTASHRPRSAGAFRSATLRRAHVAIKMQGIDFPISTVSAPRAGRLAVSG
jgi:hypothetical protein